MTFTYVDAIVAAIVAISAFLAYSRGLTRELLAIGGWILAALLAFYLAPAFAPIVAEIPWLGPKLAGSCLILMIASFSIIVAFGLLLLAVFTPIFASAVLDSVLGPVDRVLGFLFGIARGLLLVAVGYLIYDSFVGGESVPALENAASRGIFEETAQLIDQYRPREMPPWLENRISALTAPCGGGETPEAVEPVLPDSPAQQG
ncbi:MAG TPA: CvpA family protein [Paracoccaceae bacterium]|nr:CvpA family protein [Paracoccaceae bacterium]